MQNIKEIQWKSKDEKYSLSYESSFDTDLNAWLASNQTNKQKKKPEQVNELMWVLTSCSVDWNVLDNNWANEKMILVTNKNKSIPDQLHDNCHYFTE